MDLQNSTILITGGSSGIGLELANRLQQKGNTVIICSRSQEKLATAMDANPGLITHPCDIADPESCKVFADWLQTHYPQLNILINNAAITHNTSFISDPDIIDKAGREIETNFMGPLRLIKLLLPLVTKNTSASIINVTTGLVYAPRASYPIYNATKAALHSFTQVLRIQLQASPVQVVEVLFPVVDTPWHKGNAPKIAISPQQAVTGMIDGLQRGKSEIHVGAVKLLYLLYRISPSLALRKINSLH